MSRIRRRPKTGGSDSSDDTNSGSRAGDRVKSWRTKIAVVGKLHIIKCFVGGILFPLLFIWLCANWRCCFSVPTALPVGKDPPNFSFPSVEERIEYYMASWYNQTFGEDNQEACREFCKVPYYRTSDPQYEGIPNYHHPFLFDENTIRRAHDVARKFQKRYTSNVIDHYFNNIDEDLKMIFAFGDNLPMGGKYPVVVKSRPSQRFSKNDSLPILGFLNVFRHYSEVEKVTAYPWEKKKNIIVWRGIPSGGVNRINVLQQYLGAPDVDFGFTSKEWTTQMVPNQNLQNLLRKKRLKIKELTAYKYLLSLEGNDVATGLKWMLYSDSVVFMAPPTHVSWAMEEKLVPFVHYVPLKDDHSNILEMVKWARNNDEACHNISMHATRFMEDLYVSDKARRETRAVLAGIVHRYHEQFGHILNQCPYQSNDDVVEKDP